MALHYFSGSGQNILLHSIVMLHNMLSMWNKISYMGFVHLFNYSTHMLHVQFISIQNLSYSPSSSSLCFCASSSLSFVGMKFWVRWSLTIFHGVQVVQNSHTKVSWYILRVSCWGHMCILLGWWKYDDRAFLKKFRNISFAFLVPLKYSKTLTNNK